MSYECMYVLSISWKCDFNGVPPSSPYGHIHMPIKLASHEKKIYIIKFVRELSQDSDRNDPMRKLCYCVSVARMEEGHVI